MSMSLETFLETNCTIDGFQRKTWRYWLYDALATLLEECENFSGKRPNCDSGWESKLAAALDEVYPGLVEEWSEDDDYPREADSIDWERYRNAVRDLVECAFRINS